MITITTSANTTTAAIVTGITITTSTVILGNITPSIVNITAHDYANMNESDSKNYDEWGGAGL